MIRNLQAFAQRNFPINGIEIHFMGKPDENHITLIKEVIFETVDYDQAVIIDNTPGRFIVSMEAGQRLMDDLWGAGIRPSDSRDRADIIQAKNEHIGDLRKITFDLMSRIK